MVNDVTPLVVYRMTVGALVTGHFSSAHTALTYVGLSMADMGIGLVTAESLSDALCCLAWKGSS